MLLIGISSLGLRHFLTNYVRTVADTGWGDSYPEQRRVRSSPQGRLELRFRVSTEQRLIANVIYRNAGAFSLR